MLTHIHPSCSWFTCKTRSSSSPLLSGSVSGSRLDPPSAQSPFARFGCYPPRQNVAHPVGRSYPAFIAHMDSCDEPRPSARFRFLIRPVFAGCGQPLLGIGPSRCYLLSLCVGAWTPTPPRLFAARIRFSTKSFGLTLSAKSSARETYRRYSNFSDVQFFGAAVIPLCSGSHTC